MRVQLVSVIGGGKDLAKPAVVLAESVGAALARAGFGLVTGGLGGVMESVCRGFSLARGKATWPPIVGVLPGYEGSSANDYVDITLPTGLGYARNVVVAAAGEACLCIGGAMGALSEIALARKIGRPVLVFAESGGTAGLASKVLHSVHAVASVEEAMAKLKELLSGSSA